MPLITLTTDFGTKDHFVGSVKGAIYSELPTARIVDISHEITPFNIAETAYILKNSYKSFPDKTVHIVGVDSELSVENKHIALELNNHFFICPDNGLISMIASEIRPSKLVEINIHSHVKSSFSVLDVFVKVAAHIARGGSLNVIGREIQDYKKSTEIQPKVNSDKTIIQGEVIYIDNYGNVVTNISKKMFHEIGKGRNYTLFARSYAFKFIYNKYNDYVDFSVPKEKRQNDGEKLAIFNTAGFIEIAVYRSDLKNVGGANTLLGLDYQDKITVEFESIAKEAFLPIN